MQVKDRIKTKCAKRGDPESSCTQTMDRITANKNLEIEIV